MGLESFTGDFSSRDGVKLETEGELSAELSLDFVTLSLAVDKFKVASVEILVVSLLDLLMLPSEFCSSPSVFFLFLLFVTFTGLRFLFDEGPSSIGLFLLPFLSFLC